MDLINSFLEVPTDIRLRMVLDAGNYEILCPYFGKSSLDELVRIANLVIPSLERNRLGIRTPTNLIFIPGVMGSWLKSSTFGSIWWITLQTRGRIDDLRLSSDGLEDDNPDYQIVPCGIDPCYDPFLAAVLKRDDFGHEVFAYDWRKSLTRSSDSLRETVVRLYATNGNRPIHLVAHSMGGLLVRATLMKHGEELWPKLGRIVFIGTPHYGSPAIACYLKNHLCGSPLMFLLGSFLSPATYRSLWGVLNLLPAPREVYPGTRSGDSSSWFSIDDSEDTYRHPCVNFDIYNVDNWKLNLSTQESSQLQKILDATSNFHRQLYEYHMGLDQKLRNRMAVIVGVGYKTLFSLRYQKQFWGIWEQIIKDTKRQNKDPHHEGDGSVPMASARLEYVGETRYIKGLHGGLTNIPQVYEDVFRWLNGDNFNWLSGVMELPKSPEAALGLHLAGETSRSDASPP